MAKQRQDSTPVLDWYLISVDRLKYAGIILLLAVIGAGAYFYRDLVTKSPHQRAQSAIADAEKALNDLASAKEFNAFRAEFDRGQGKLAEARQLMSEQKYEEAQTAAVDAQSIVRSALAQLPGEQDSDAQFLSVEGNVQYQHAGGAWRTADVRTLLINGDWVKTGSGASAELIFSNGSLYTVGPDALLEIYSSVNPATSRKRNSVKMEVGTVQINTADDSSTVSTPGTEVVVGSSSSAQVGVDEQDRTEIVALRGSSTIAPTGATEKLTLESGQKVRSSSAGQLSDVSTVIDPPKLQSPTDNQVIPATRGQTIDLTWIQAPDARAYRLQVSRSRLFGTVEIDATRSSTRAKTKITSEGSFYWRVASIDANGEIGPFSSYRRFRVTGIAPSPSRAGEMDTTPPTLEIKRPFSLGGANFMIEGKAEPGATVFVNELEVGVESDGTFRKLVTFNKVGPNEVVIKAVDPAGNQTIKREKVWVEE